jgi:alanine racemase
MGRLFRHITNSGGSFRDPAWQLDGVRPGLALYGYNPGLADEEDETGPGPAALRALRPILQWKTRVVQVRRVPEGFPVSYDSTWRAPRDTCLATLDAGYADGYFRSHGNQSHVVIRGRRRPVAGRVTMNLLMVDAGPEGDVREDDEALLIGEQDGACVWADELAALARTIPYEVLTSIRTDEVRTKGGGASHA